MEVATRQAYETDYDWLFKLKVVCMRPYIEAVYGWDDGIQKTFFDEDFRPHDIQIITLGGADAGMFEASHENEEFFLRRIEIHPQYQRLGVGSTIIRKMLRRASVAGEPVMLNVFKVNPAKNLYKRLGFRVFNETETHYEMRCGAADAQRAEQASDGKPETVAS